ncbi:MAG: hypothetical protein ABIQ89_03615, partial [Candidatus Saccharimonadales bacterium]
MMKLARIHRRDEPIWHVQLAILAAIFVQVFLPQEYVIGSHYAIAIFEGALLIALSLPGGKRPSLGVLRRILSIILLSLITLTNIASLALVSNSLLSGAISDGHVLIYSALIIYATNIIVFGLFYWELDDQASNGNPDGDRDFLFPQMTSSEEATKQRHWQPTF